MGSFFRVTDIALLFLLVADTYSYDNNGNRLTKQAVLTGQEATPQQTGYGYDFKNRLDSLNYANIPGMTGSQTDHLVYNGEGLRVQVNINGSFTNYLYDGSDVILEADGSNNVTKAYNRGPGLPGGIGSAEDPIQAPAKKRKAAPKKTAGKKPPAKKKATVKKK